ncbi:cytochrome c oxidase assembly protein CtaG/Cox11-domain-containing protein [Pseudoneurospora amorphoporcata]|uniref:Cytochrome c oxidase assembly protein CtaG/Cox11-domain-containing protein n=1 Tax=Pseudoneurospora amorphoporcata TaxID=241081 RepID=A0AAN6SHA0_9PEZI|nr:cytochrome c oxidase assembly protein CtaG/Cox11-domain-containing protein [Pseudoneurospora amorphoporcata]
MSSVPRFVGRRVVAAQSSQLASPWACYSCRQQFQNQWRRQLSSDNATPREKTTTATQQQALGAKKQQNSSSNKAWRWFSTEGASRRQQQQGQQQQQQTRRTGVSPEMEKVRAEYKKRNQSTMYYVISIILGTVAFSYGSVPMYKMICQTTGWGGQPVRAHGAGGFGGSDSDVDLAAKLEPVTDAKRMRVTFNASVSDVLPWKFVPQQREVRVLPGETALAFYTATNKSDKDIIGVATYSVTPAQVAPYFSKIQCFCFEEQRLNAGETVDMPVFFYLDPDYLNDLNMKGIETVTLSYTFFKAKYDDNGVLKGVPGAS